ncbi:zinc ABC transporter ATP-binding protein ZnuC [Buchnera aphidicola]|uniref:zinc ABC transporter ATP-binding protein ZnuC n=1 Tax=Buchnera aphidicola TaxID=9 RepID=UPI0031B83607
MKKIIEIKKLSFEINKKEILSNVSFTLMENKIITLIGPNGAGKSTLVKILIGLLKPYQGKIISKPNLVIGYVPQKFKFNENFPISVYRFMQLFYKTNKIEIMKNLDRVKAQHLINQPIGTLSGGELQRILLARTLSCSPGLLVLDEPTQGVDISGQIFLYQLLHELKKELKCSILLVSHDLNLVMKKTDEVICLNKHICCSGTPMSITKNCEFVSLFGSHALQELTIYQHEHDHIHIF